METERKKGKGREKKRERESKRKIKRAGESTCVRERTRENCLLLA